MRVAGGGSDGDEGGREGESGRWQGPGEGGVEDGDDALQGEAHVTERTEGGQGFGIRIGVLCLSRSFSSIRKRGSGVRPVTLRVYPQTSWHEPFHVGPQCLRQRFRQRSGFAAEDLDLVREPRAAAEDVIRQSRECAGQAGGVGAQLGEVRLRLGGERGEGDGVGAFGGCGGEAEGGKGGVQVGGGIEGGGEEGSEDWVAGMEGERVRRGGHGQVEVLS